MGQRQNRFGGRHRRDDMRRSGRALRGDGRRTDQAIVAGSRVRRDPLHDPALARPPRQANFGVGECRALDRGRFGVPAYPPTSRVIVGVEIPQDGASASSGSDAISRRSTSSLGACSKVSTSGCRRAEGDGKASGCSALCGGDAHPLRDRREPCGRGRHGNRGPRPIRISQPVQHQPPGCRLLALHPHGSSSGRRQQPVGLCRISSIASAARVDRRGVSARRASLSRPPQPTLQSPPIRGIGAPKTIGRMS